MKNSLFSKNIQAVAVNHNTSKYSALLLRSLFASHPGNLDIAVRVYDNNSQDDRRNLDAFASANGIPILPSGFETKTKWNSHGEILNRFVREHPDCDYLLFLDADVCFLKKNTLDVMLQELQEDETAFAINPKLTSNAESEIASEYWPVVYESRLHPCCALVKNTNAFQRVVAEIGLSSVKVLWAHGEEYFDTFRLMTKAMKTHGFRVIHSRSMVQHFFCVSYDLEPENIMEKKAKLRDSLMERFRPS